LTDTKHYLTIGTNPTPYYVPFNDAPETIQTNQGYFCIQIVGAQAAFTGSFWTGAQNLAITSQVNLNLGEQHNLGNQDLRSILLYRALNKNTAVQLGFSPLLIDFIPARMKHVSVSIEYLVNTKNYLKDIVGLITDKDLFSIVSLAPGAAMAAKTLGGLAEKLISTFVPAEERKPILQFSGDFDLAAEGLKEGYHIILGSHTTDNPLPTKPPEFTVLDGGGLLMNKKPVTELSYVILKICCTRSIRDRFMEQSSWYKKLTEAKRLANDYGDDPFADSDLTKKKEYWEKQCLPVIREARALLSDDANFLSSEVDLVYRQAYKECLEIITGKTTRGKAFVSWSPDATADRKFLGIPEEEDIDARLGEYAEHVYKARKAFQEIAGHRD
jgi:hypothetical protein